MVEPALTPAHPYAFATLLDEPCAGTLDHTGAQRESSCLIRLIVDMLAMPCQIGMDCHDGVPCGRRQSLYVQGVLQVGQDTGRPTVAQAVPCPGKPSACLA